MTTLMGWAVPTQVASYLDHTYVTSTDGHVWPCWGESLAGKLICIGSGDSAKANCISQTESHAGIIYALTGVCHQTANRILFPSGKIVSEAAGYWLSVTLYGTYGTSITDFRKRLFDCKCSTTRRTLKPETTTSATNEADAPTEPSALQSYITQVNGLYANHVEARTTEVAETHSSHDILSSEFELMVNYRLDQNISHSTMATMKGIQTDILGQKGQLDQQFSTGSIDASLYAKKVNELAERVYAENARLLGKEQTVKLLGIKDGTNIQLVVESILINNR